jgi:hypothetical protein
MAEIQFAAGARQVLPVHELAAPLCCAGRMPVMPLQDLPMKPLLTKFMSAHVMGGCGMAGDESARASRGPTARHWQIEQPVRA